MDKAVMISIRPECVKKIARGEKIIEVRKTRPKLGTPFKCYIYQTLPKSGDWNDRDGHVIGEFVCDEIIEDKHRENALLFEKKGRVPFDVQKKYGSKQILYGWHISDLIIYDMPKRLSEFMQCHKCEYYSRCKEHEYGCNGAYKVTRPPQSFMYVEELP